MQISDFGLELVKAFEGFFPKPYFCPAGVRTQGFGHTAAAGAPALGGVWTREYASGVLLRTITARYAAPVEKMLKRKPTQGQFDAMVSLAYNIGVDSFGGSSVLRNFNAGNDAAAVASFALWNKAAGKVMPGLVRRRASEALAYQGFQDVNFDGKRQPSEPIYGPMPRAVEAADAPPLISGGGSSGGAGASGAWDSPAPPISAPVEPVPAPSAPSLAKPASQAPAPAASVSREAQELGFVGRFLAALAKRLAP